MPLPLARARAREIREAIEPLVERIEVVGSIRRERETVGDIEFLAAPRMRAEPDLFHQGDEVPDLEPVVAELHDLGSIAQAGDRFVQVVLEEDPLGRRRTLDLFLCHPPAAWGALKVIRTGPSAYSQIAVTRIRDRGWRCWRGAVWRRPDGRPGPGEEVADDPDAWERVPTPTEDDFFEAARMSGSPPELRDEVVERFRRYTRERSHG
jgi:DNA polymerase/3'-5' exonuclease PolX